MMNEKHLPKSYWVEVANMTIYLMNWCTIFRVLDVTPHEKFYGKKLHLSHIKIFNWITYVHILNKKK